MIDLYGSAAYTKLTNMGVGCHFYPARGVNSILEHPPSLKVGTMKIEDISPQELQDIQAEFDDWSRKITGGVSDVLQSSHGQAFIAGWIAREDYAA